MATRPWKPVSVLEVDNRNPNYAYRWCAVGMLDKRMTEGWEVVKAVSKTAERSPSVTLVDGTQVSSVIRKGNLVLCRMPKELAESRRKYYEDMSKTRLASVDKSFDNEIGGSSYGSVIIEKEPTGTEVK